MNKYKVSGMSCAACSARVERAVSSIDGVTSCSVNLLTGTMLVEGADEKRITEAVRLAGYSAEPYKEIEGDKREKEGNAEIKALVKRLLFSLFLLAVLMYISMGHVMWGFPLPQFVAESPLAIGFIQLFLSLAVMLINNKFFVSGARALCKGAPNMDSLVGLGSLASFVWSAFVVLKTAFSESVSHAFLHELYFESAAMILGFITLGKLLEALAKGKTTSAIESLLELTPKLTHVIRNGEEMLIPSKDVVIGDVFIVRPGESFAQDGIVIAGEGMADESSLTGESLPLEKNVGSSVFAGTVNITGYLECRAVRVGDSTLLGEVVKMITDASATKAPIAKLADRVAGIFVPAVLGIAILTTFIWLFVNNSLGYALARGVSVLVISCPCALGLATPVAIMVASGIGARGGALFKTATSIELAGRAKTVVFDKTGTLTEGKLSVSDIVPLKMDESELLSLFTSLEVKSEHPIARAIVDCAEERGLEIYPAENFKALAGNGVEASVNGKTAVSGSYKFIKSLLDIDDDAEQEYIRLSSEGKTVVFFVYAGELCGMLACADSLRAESTETVAALRKIGMRCVMLTGDNAGCAAVIAEKLGIDEYRAEMLPQDKAMFVKELSEDGCVIMVGDGINDAPALTVADVGIAVGRGTDIAIESADVVLMNENLGTLFGAIKLGRAALLNIKENLFWAFFYNAVGIPLAAGAFISLLGWELSPMFGALAMSLSSFSVVMNALRLNLKKFFACKIDDEKGENKMLTLKIRGMMCPHCEARVKSTLEAFPGVTAEVSHKKGVARVKLNGNVSPDDLVKAVIDAGYKCEISE